MTRSTTTRSTLIHVPSQKELICGSEESKLSTTKQGEPPSKVKKVYSLSIVSTISFTLYCSYQNLLVLQQNRRGQPNKDNHNQERIRYISTRVYDYICIFYLSYYIWGCVHKPASRLKELIIKATELPFNITSSAFTLKGTLIQYVEKLSHPYITHFCSLTVSLTKYFSLVHRPSLPHNIQLKKITQK